MLFIIAVYHPLFQDRRDEETDKRNEKLDGGSRASIQQGDVKQPDVVPTARLKYSLLFEH